MAGGPDALLEELRAATDGILALPDGLLELAMGDGPFDLARRMDRLDMRLPALRLLVDAREVGKALDRRPGWERGRGVEDRRGRGERPGLPLVCTT